MKKMNKLAGIVGAFVAAVAVAAPANASTGWICQELDSHPNTTGVTNIIVELMTQGYTADNGGPELFAATVFGQCPEYVPVVQKAVEQLA